MKYSLASDCCGAKATRERESNLFAENKPSAFIKQPRPSIVDFLQKKKS
jgi:hypothetical protein